MFLIKRSVPVSEGNKNEYLAVCSEFKKGNFKTIWSPMFGKEDSGSSEASFTVPDYEIFVNDISDDETSENGKSISEYDLKTSGADQPLTLSDYISQEKISEIKDALVKDSDKLDFGILHAMPTDLVESFCKEINISEASVSTLKIIADQVIGMDPPLNSVSASVLIHNMIYPKVLSNDASRNLINVTVSFCDKYSAAIVNGLLKPLLHCENFGSLQLEIFTSIMNSSKLEDYDYRQIRDGFPEILPSQYMFSLLTLFIGIENFMDDQAFGTLIEKLKEWSSEHSANLKYNNLLLKVIKVYGKKLNVAQHSVLEEILTDSNSSFKTLALKELNKLKK